MTDELIEKLVNAQLELTKKFNEILTLMIEERKTNIQRNVYELSQMRQANQMSNALHRRYDVIQ